MKDSNRDVPASRNLQGSEHVLLEDLIAERAGVLSPEAAQRIDEHLELCPRCAAEAERFLTDTAEWDNAGYAPRLEEVRQRLRAAFRNATSGPVGGPPSTSDTSFGSLDSKELPLVERLYQVGAIEYGCDFVLPNGLHADTHFNTGAICSSEQALQMVTAALRDSLDKVSFDTVVSTGWAMACIGRRLIHSLGPAGQKLKHVRVEGYSDLAPLRAIARSSTSLLLLDIVATGDLARRATEVLERVGPVAVRALVSADPAPNDLPTSFEALCLLPMELSQEEDCRRCGQLPRWEYNPVACHLTERKRAPFSVSCFLQENPNAVEFWDLVSAAQAYEHHHVEGRRHYTAYVDTLRLVTCPSTGPAIVDQFCATLDQMAKGFPSVLVTRNRATAVTFARAVAARCQVRNGIDAPLIIARTRGPRIALSEADVESLRSKHVLIIDTATAHGDTIDELDILVRECGASAVGAGVILSRLGEAREVAFAKRLTGGFFRLYSVPVPPVEIHSGRLGCHVCAQRDSLRAVALTSRSAELEALVVRRQGHRKRQRAFPRAVQLSVELAMSNAPLLERCRRGVAGGVALHALHSSMGNGMAPVVLPEISDSRVPVSNRTAILEDLPAATLRKWSGDALFQDLARRLPEVNDPKLWAATAGFLERAGSSGWLPDLRPMIKRAGADLTPKSEFWNQLTFVAFRASQSDPDCRSNIRAELRDLIAEFRDSPTSARLRAMLTAVDYSVECTFPEVGSA